MGRWEMGWDLPRSYSWKSSIDPKVQQIQWTLEAKVHYDDHKLPKSTCLQWQNKVSDLFYFRMASKNRLKLLLTHLENLQEAANSPIMVNKWNKPLLKKKVL